MTSEGRRIFLGLGKTQAGGSSRTGLPHIATRPFQREPRRPSTAHAFQTTIGESTLAANTRSHGIFIGYCSLQMCVPRLVAVGAYPPSPTHQTQLIQDVDENRCGAFVTSHTHTNTPTAIY